LVVQLTLVELSMSVRPTPLSTELSNVNVGCFVWLKIDSWLVVPLCL